MNPRKALWIGVPLLLLVALLVWSLLPDTNTIKQHPLFFLFSFTGTGMSFFYAFLYDIECRSHIKTGTYLTLETTKLKASRVGELTAMNDILEFKVERLVEENSRLKAELECEKATNKALEYKKRETEPER